MTNLEKWLYYTKDLISPTSYIEMGFYWLISAALQRRVWLGSEERPLFPNMYILLVGRPAIGKGLVIKPLIEILTFHKMRHKDKFSLDNPQNTLDQAVSVIESEMYRGYIDKQYGKNGSPSKDRDFDPLLFPTAADSTTYEALVRRHAEAVRFHFITDPAYENHPFVKDKKYKHCSISVLLEEVSTLFRKHSEDVINYLMKAFDCGDHVHDTKTQGTDRIQRMCLNLLSGTTPDFIRETFTDRILNEGFASRTIVVYEDRNRFNRFDIASLCKDQIKCKAEIILHIKALHKLFGKLSYAPDAYNFMKHYVEEVIPNSLERSNLSPKLESYYGRKNIHIQKLATAIHFSESTEMMISLDACVRAVELLDRLEVNMDKALSVRGKNVVGDVIDRIPYYLAKYGEKTRTEIWGEFIKDLTETQLDEAIKFLTETNRIEKIEESNERGIKVYRYRKVIG